MMIKILHLYKKEMNFFPDNGNILVLKKRCEWRGIDVEIVEYEPNGEIPEDADIIFGGGGAVSGKGEFEKDMLKIAPKLKEYVEKGTPVLAVCGIFQAFGKYFRTADGKEIPCADIIDMYSTEGADRFTGNIVAESTEYGQLVGYENHSGRTYLGEGCEKLASVTLGKGNNGEDGSEGTRYKNFIGTYINGPILAKNVKLADFLIAKALENKGESAELKPLDDFLEENAHRVHATRPR